MSAWGPDCAVGGMDTEDSDSQRIVDRSDQHDCDVGSPDEDCGRCSSSSSVREESLAEDTLVTIKLNRVDGEATRDEKSVLNHPFQAGHVYRRISSSSAPVRFRSNEVRRHTQARISKQRATLLSLVRTGIPPKDRISRGTKRSVQVKEQTNRRRLNSIERTVRMAGEMTFSRVGLGKEGAYEKEQAENMKRFWAIQASPAKRGPKQVEGMDEGESGDSDSSGGSDSSTGYRCGRIVNPQSRNQVWQRLGNSYDVGRPTLIGNRAMRIMN